MEDLIEKYDKEIAKLKELHDLEKNNLIKNYEKKIKDMQDELTNKLQKGLEDLNMRNQETVTFIYTLLLIDKILSR